MTSFIMWFFPALLLNALVGAVVCTCLDTKDQVFYRWYKTDKTGVGCFLVLTFWPILAIMMIRYKRR